jgi:hypothetical protein
VRDRQLRGRAPEQLWARTDNSKCECRGSSPFDFAQGQNDRRVRLRKVCTKKRGQDVLRSVAGDFGGEDADIFDAAVALGVVHAVADDELVGDLEGYVVGFDGD